MTAHSAPVRKRIMVDMTASWLHHGHVRLLAQAQKKGYVIVALTRDSEIKRVKGYVPELNFNQRKEILESLRHVDEVVPAPWLLNEEFLDKHAIDLLVHGDDNANPIASARLLILPRTPGVASSKLREKSARIYFALAKAEKPLSRNH